MGSTSKRCLRFCAALLAAWLGLRLVLPLMYPFLQGTDRLEFYASAV